MRILVMWRRGSKIIRNTILDHAFSFAKYDKDNEYFYFDIMRGRWEEDYSWISPDMFDAVIFHYSCLSLRTSRQYWDNYVTIMEKVWKSTSLIKIMMPQDDYTNTRKLWEFARKIDVDIIYTIIRKENYPILYPINEIPDSCVETIFTGYIDEKYISKNYLPHKNRPLDVVYRARKLDYSFGRHGQLKYQLAELFSQTLASNKTVFKYDIANTNREKDALLADDWMLFLSSARITIGCLGGASIADIDGKISEGIHLYLSTHDDEKYDQVKANVFPNVKENIMGMISPRIFESALTHTCQVLVGRDYQGILRPEIDYIVLEEDFSNLEDVVEKMQDISYCEKIAATCYEHIVISGEYSYGKLVQKVVNDIKTRIKIETKRDKKLSEKIQYYVDKNNERVYKEMA